MLRNASINNSTSKRKSDEYGKFWMCAKFTQYQYKILNVLNLILYLRKIKVPEKLLKLEKRMKAKERQHLKQSHDANKKKHELD